MAEKDMEELKKRFTTDLKTARDFMNPIHQAMDQNYEMYRNRWDKNDKEEVKVSSLYSYVETVVPILTNSRVRAVVHSDYPEYIQHAKGLNDILDHTYDINDWDYQQQKVARMAEIYRSAACYTGWDADYKNKTGRLCIKPINIRWCYLDPGAVEFEESSFFFYVEPKRKSQVIKMHPNKKKEIENSLSRRGNLTDSGNAANKWFQTFVRAVKNLVTFNGDNTMNRHGYETREELSEEEKHKNSVAYIHYWYRDDNDDWRVSFWADDVPLEDMDNPFWHGRLPYDIYNPTGDILSTIGVPISEQIESLNYEKNAMLGYINDNAKLFADPVLIYNTMAGIKDPQALREKADKDKILGVPNPDFAPLNSMATYFTPNSLPTYAIDLPDRYGAMEDRITGVNDSFRGMSEATSGKEVQLKQEAAYTRIKTKIDAFERFNKSSAEKIIVNAMQYHKESRAFRIKGDHTKYEGMPQESAPFEVQPIQKGMNPESQEPVFDRSEFFMYANPYEWTQDGLNESAEAPGEEAADEKPETKEQVQESFKILQMTVEIEAGSSLPISRMARKEEALELGMNGFIDQEAVLEAYEWPDRDEILKRMQEAAQAQQEAQIQQQQAQDEAQAQQQQQQMQMQMQQKQMELQAKAQEQAKSQEHQTAMNEQNNAAKLQQVNTKNQQQQPDVASELDALRQKVPELANVPDEVLLQILASLPKAG